MNILENHHFELSERKQIVSVKTSNRHCFALSAVSTEYVRVNTKSQPDRQSLLGRPKIVVVSDRFFIIEDEKTYVVDL